MGINWENKWRAVSEERWRTYIEGELRWEVAHFPQHPLHAVAFHVVGALDRYDNFIIRLDDERTYAYVLLAWKAESPHFELIGDADAVNRFIRSV